MYLPLGRPYIIGDVPPIFTQGESGTPEDKVLEARTSKVISVPGRTISSQKNPLIEVLSFKASKTTEVRVPNLLFNIAPFANAPPEPIGPGGLAPEDQVLVAIS